MLYCRKRTKGGGFVLYRSHAKMKEGLGSVFWDLELGLKIIRVGVECSVCPLTVMDIRKLTGVPVDVVSVLLARDNQGVEIAIQLQHKGLQVYWLPSIGDLLGNLLKKKPIDSYTLKTQDYTRYVFVYTKIAKDEII